MTNMKPWDIIKNLENDNSKNFKVDIISAEAVANNDTFFEGLTLALHPLLTFGVKQIPFSTVAASDTQELDWDDFVMLTDELIGRTLTGHAARDAIVDIMNQAGQAQWDGWLRRILIQDMRAGFSESTVNKAVKKAGTYDKHGIPVFKCMLAHDSKKNEKKVTGKKQIEVKLDGARVLTIVRTDGTVIQTTRSGKELKNFRKIADQFTNMEGLEEDMVFDGEVMSSNFQDLMKQLNRKTNVETDDAVLHVFDMLPLSEFMAGKSTKTQEERSEQLTQLVDNKYSDGWSLLFPNINIIRSEVVDLDTEAGKVRYLEINQLALDGGYEGVMLKDLDAPYLCKRSHHWLKLKPVITVDLTVVGIEEGTGKNVGKLGALICEGTDDGKLIKVNVGGGYTDRMREDYWDDSVIGDLVEVMADAVTQNSDASDDSYSLRFPRFVRFRSIDGEKV